MIDTLKTIHLVQRLAHSKDSLNVSKYAKAFHPYLLAQLPKA